MPTMTRNASATTFEPCPEGQHAAVLADLVDIGWLETTYEGKSTGFKPHVQLVWQCHVENEDTGEDETFLVFDRRIKWSFDPKATLYKRLSDWLTPKELEAMLDTGADIEDLIGRSAYINVVHNEHNGNTYANIGGIMPLPKKMVAPEVKDYTRRVDRDDWPEKMPEFSAFEAGPAASPRPQSDAPKSNSERLASGDSSKPQPRGRAANGADQKAAVKAMAEGAKPDDSDDPFADE